MRQWVDQTKPPLRDPPARGVSSSQRPNKWGNEFIKRPLPQGGGSYKSSRKGSNKWGNELIKRPLPRGGVPTIRVEKDLMDEAMSWSNEPLPAGVSRRGVSSRKGSDESGNRVIKRPLQLRGIPTIRVDKGLMNEAMSWSNEPPPYGRDLHNVRVWLRSGLLCIVLLKTCTRWSNLCGMTHWYVTHDLCMCVVTCLYVTHGSLICVAWLIDMWHKIRLLV